MGKKLGPLNPVYTVKAAHALRMSNARVCLEKFITDLGNGQVDNPYRTVGDVIFVAACGHTLRLEKYGELVVEVIPGFVSP